MFMQAVVIDLHRVLEDVKLYEMQFDHKSIEHNAVRSAALVSPCSTFSCWGFI